MVNPSKVGEIDGLSPGLLEKTRGAGAPEHNF